MCQKKPGIHDKCEMNSWIEELHNKSFLLFKESYCETEQEKHMLTVILYHLISTKKRLFLDASTVYPPATFIVCIYYMKPADFSSCSDSFRHTNTAVLDHP